ncbi:MAG: PspA/IM30 family protein [Myxococcales bacterium]|nr:PspA/IM30 family protein [Myxococcales bacterium]MCB9701363.1 PspA/IM30 family protein [Myxococcales bacterium]
MSDKPGLFSRMRRSISSALSDAVEAVSDPGQEIALMLDDLADQIKQSERDLHQSIVDHKVMEKKAEALRKSEGEWEKRAEQAVRLGDETLARAALQRRVEIAAERQACDEGLVEQRKLIESMRQGIAEAKTKHKQLNLRRGTLIAQARAAKKGMTSTGAIHAGGGLDRMSAIEDRIAQLEAFNEVHAETMDAAAQEAAIDAQLAALGAGGATSEVDDALEALKAKMRAQQAITAGKDKGEG